MLALNADIKAFCSFFFLFFRLVINDLKRSERLAFAAGLQAWGETLHWVSRLTAKLYTSLQGGGVDVCLTDGNLFKSHFK